MADENRQVEKSFMRQNVFIRLKRDRKFYFCEYYDGMRLMRDSIPNGKYMYQTRHSDSDICHPVSIAPLGQNVIVNFCGTIVSDMPIALDAETKIMVIHYDNPYDKSLDCIRANTH